ncbi:MAG TPA: RHS repeat-associated core domain-containing protein [Pirellulales bacterium]
MKWIETNKYDMFNNLVGQQVVSFTAGVANSSQHFIYDNGQIVLDLADDGAVQDRYLWAPAVDLLLAQEDASNNVLWALDDNLNSIRDWIDNSGAVVAHNAFDAFGDLEASLSSGTVNAVFGFTGVFRDSLTGFQYNQYGDSRGRWYDPETGRFLSQDPTGFAAGDANLYRYVDNSPTNFVDPTGQTVWSAPQSYRFDQVNARIQELQQQGTPITFSIDENTKITLQIPSNSVASELAELQAERADLQAAIQQAAQGLKNGAFGLACPISPLTAFGHGARHLAGTGLSQSAVEGAINAQIKAAAAAGSKFNGGFWGRAVVDGSTIEYRAFTLPNGTINIGTYYIP